MHYEIKELGVGGILDQTIKLIKNHFVLFFLIVFAFVGPLQILFNLLNPTTSIIEQMSRRPGQQVEPSAGPETIVFLILTATLYIIALPITNAAVVHAVAAEYLEQPTSVGKAFARGLRVVIPLIWTGILVWFATMLGFLACFVPGILASIWFFLSTQIVVIEGTNGFAAMRRSRELMRGNAGTLIVLGIVLFAVNCGIGVISPLIPEKHVSAVFMGIMQSFVIIFGATAWVVFYFSCRCKAENFDLSILADAVSRDDPEADPVFPAT